MGVQVTNRRLSQQIEGRHKALCVILLKKSPVHLSLLQFFLSKPYVHLSNVEEGKSHLCSTEAQWQLMFANFIFTA